MLLFVGGIALLAHRGAPNPIRRDLPFAALYLSNLVPMHSLLSITWSLSAEEQFYGVVPALERYAGRAFGLLLPILYLVVSLPPLGLFAGLPLPDFFRQTTFGPILLGVLLAHVLDSPEGYRQIARVLGGRGAGLWALALVLVTCSFPAQDISGWPRLAIQGSLAILVASCVVQERHALSPLLRLAPLRRLGTVSYGVYLYHLVVLHFVEGLATKRGLSAQLPKFVATVAATWLVAELSFRWFESRFLAQKRRFAPPVTAEPVAAASVPAVMGQPAP
jgi:peptidoglycan/LPS O-acetylase OafA/YrhL